MSASEHEIRKLDQRFERGAELRARPKTVTIASVTYWTDLPAGTVIIHRATQLKASVTQGHGTGHGCFPIRRDERGSWVKDTTRRPWYGALTVTEWAVGDYGDLK